MYLLVIAWIYVVLMMAVSEATSTQGTVLGAVVTFLLYGVAPLSIVLYLMRTPARRAQRRRAEEAQTSGDTPDGGGQTSGDAIAPERKEP